MSVVVVLFELVGAALAVCATGSGIAGMLVARAKTRAIASVAATVPDLLESPEVATPAAGPFRTPAPQEREASAPSTRRRRRRGKLRRHDYDLMIGRSFFR